MVDDHLLLHCEVARELWSLALASFGDHWTIMPKKVIEVLWSWKGLLGIYPTSKAWSAIPLYIMWEIWTFEGEESLAMKLKFLLLSSLFEWNDCSRRFSLGFSCRVH